MLKKILLLVAYFTIICVMNPSSVAPSSVAKTDLHGIQVDNSKLIHVKIGQTSKQVYELIGSPNLIDDISNPSAKTWYYVFEEQNRFLFFQPVHTSNSQILMVQFDQNDLVDLIVPLKIRDTQHHVKVNNLRTKIDKTPKQSLLNWKELI